MVALFVTSPEPRSGKTMICAGLGKRFVSDGKRTGYFKPRIGAGDATARDTDHDAGFMKHLLALEEPAELLCPVLSGGRNLTAGIKKAYATVSRGEDIVIVEGVSGQSQFSRSIVEALDAKVIVIESMSIKPVETAGSYKEWGKRLLGVVVNKVPRSRLERISAEASAAFEKSGVNLLGVLPEDRMLLALTVGELAGHIRGTILSSAEKSAELVENFMVGAKCVDPGPVYFGRKANKAAVIESERPDMQIAALATSTRCLVVSGSTAPIPVVLRGANEKSVPVVHTTNDIKTIVTSIEDALAGTRFNQEGKLPRLIEILEQHFDFAGVYNGLGLAVS